MKVLIFSLLIFFVSFPCLGSVVEEKKFSLEKEAGEILVIEGHQKGILEIRGVETDLVRLSGHLEVKGEDQVEIRQFYEGVAVSASRAQEKVIIEISRPAVLSPGMDHAIYLQLLVPREMDLEIITGTGEIKIEEISGNIKIEGSGAFLKIKGGTGNIEATGLKKGFIEDFTGGKIYIRSEQEVKLKNVQGDIQEEIKSEQ